MGLPKGRPRRNHGGGTRWFAASVCGGASLFLGGEAQGAKPKTAAPREDDTVTVVVTGTRTPESVQRATVRTEVVSRAEAERRGATNVAEALATQPGVQVNSGAYGYLGGVGAIQMQGFDRERVVLLEDGERIIGDVGGAVDLTGLPLTDVSRIEIVTGPTSSLYGTSAIGGVVNILTAPPSVEGMSGRLRMEGRSPMGLLFQGQGALRRQDHWVAVDGSVQRNDGIARAEGLPDLRVPDRERALAGLRAGIRWTPHLALRARLRWLGSRDTGVESQLTPGLGRFVLDEPETAQRWAAQILQEGDLGHGIGVRTSLAAQVYGGLSDKVYRASPVKESRERSYGMRSFETTVTIPEGTRTWVAGVRGEAEHFEQSLSKTGSGAAGLVTTKTEEVQPVGLSSAAVYGQLSWKPHSKWTLLPGLRQEVRSRYGLAFAPRLALAYRPQASLTVRAAAGRGFRSPSAKELGFVFDHGFYGYKVVGTPNLLPESSWGVQADMTVRGGRGFTWRASGFYNWVQDLIDIDVAGAKASNGIVEYTYRNFGRARTAGVEVGMAVAKAPGFRSDLSYNYLWTRDDLLGRPLSGRPPHTLTATVEAALPFRLSFVARFRVMGSAYVAGGLPSPLVTTLDGRLARPLFPGIQAHGGVLNLTDAHPDAGRVGDMRPPLGRVFYLGVSTEWPGDGSSS